MDATRLHRWEWAGVVVALGLLAYWLLDTAGVIGDWTSGSTVTYTEYNGQGTRR